jgi:carotenoid cleavage dioxygenase-like enzyme
LTHPTPKAWSQALAQPGVEFPATPLPVLEGKIPPGLQGSFYQNGPGCLQRGGRRAGHWFDGDGAILAVHFRPSQVSDSSQSNSNRTNPIQATGCYRYVQSQGYQAEVKADRYLFNSYGMTPPGPLWQRWGKPLRNAANTAVLALDDRLLALWEGGLPHALDRETLETQGLDRLSGLGPHANYSAHPKQDANTGQIYNFGMGFGKNATLNLYVSDPKGKIQRTHQHPLQGIPLIHDFVLAGPYLVFCIPPLQSQLLPVLLSLKSFSDGFVWQPQRGTEILVFDRETLTLVSRNHAEPWYQWHFSNGYLQASGQIGVDIVRYPDFQTNQRLKEVATGQVETEATGQLWHLDIDPATAQVRSQRCLCPQSCEFPQIDPKAVGQAHASTYLTLHSATVDTQTELFGEIGCYDPQRDQLTTADLGQNRYPFEPIYARDCLNPDQAWILTIVFDGNTNTSEVWIFAADRLAEGPVCRLGLPQVIPIGFHGTWCSP